MAALTREQRHARILKAGSFSRLLDEPGGKEVLIAETEDKEEKHRLIDEPQLNYLLKLHDARRRAAFRPRLFGNVADVIIVPGFLGSKLTDTKGPYGLIWIDPTIVFQQNSKQLVALQLADFVKPASPNLPEDASDRDPNVEIQATGPLPAIYDLLAGTLEFCRYGTRYFAFDWRKDLELSALALADQIRARLGQRSKPLHIIAHSQGSLVARRALQLLGPADARKTVSNLVLLGPASFGSFSAAFAFTGDDSMIEIMERFGIVSDFKTILQSFTGLYQLLPWDKEKFSNGFNPEILKKADNWRLGIDKGRLKYGFEWAKRIDTQFFNDRTSIILGDRETVGAVRFDAEGHLLPDQEMVPGDGTVTDANARLKDVRTYRMPGGVHGRLPMYPTVIDAVRMILKDEAPGMSQLAIAATRAHRPKDGGKDEKKGDQKQHDADVVLLVDVDHRPPTTDESITTGLVAQRKAGQKPSVQAEGKQLQPVRPAPPSPDYRRLRVFAFDPLLATDLEEFGIATITLELPWDGNRLLPGPIGEYIEVVDYDPASRRFYHPVDLADPRLVAQDGLPPAESNPQFHQQMAYAVSMKTVETFEKALGRVSLWAPHLERDANDEVIPPEHEEDAFVPRLRLYPHAFRDANAYYDPDRAAILFGYFPSNEKPGGKTLPGGAVFTAQSFDIVAHETTHALLHGLHRYYLNPSNPDVLAFHEAFADAVALFQKFSQTDVVRHQIARTNGDLRKENLLGKLAAQFGNALGGQRGALRQYINEVPDPSRYETTQEPHDRGAILMAALFHAFLNIYENRTKDLYRIATAGGKPRQDDIGTDLVNRLTEDASKAAKHFLTMCVRALDYVPPIDLTFGEYLRALITADYELVRDDDLHYRVAVIDAFRSWGLYPADVNVLDQSAMLWRHPSDLVAAEALRTVVQKLKIGSCDVINRDRRAVYLLMKQNCLTFREWIYKAAKGLEDHTVFGVMVFGAGYQSIPRNEANNPKFEVHSVRTCLRVGPDGQEQRDLVVEIVQRRAGYFSVDTQKEVDEAKKSWAFREKDVKKFKRKLAPLPDFWFRGGCTLIIDPCTHTIRFAIYKSVLNNDRLKRQRTFESSDSEFSLASTYFAMRGQNPFALLHGSDLTEDIYGS